MKQRKLPLKSCIVVANIVFIVFITNSIINFVKNILYLKKSQKYDTKNIYQIPNIPIIYQKYQK